MVFHYCAPRDVPLALRAEPRADDVAGGDGQREWRVPDNPRISSRHVPLVQPCSSSQDCVE
eukprot:9340603-Pyramimonas_sp.AAC.1